MDDDTFKHFCYKVYDFVKIKMCSFIRLHLNVVDEAFINGSRENFVEKIERAFIWGCCY